MTSPSPESRRQVETALFTQLRRPETPSREAESIRDELVEMHLPLVQHIAKRYAERGEPFEDIVQAGNLGLVQAVDRFDVDRGVSFSTFAVPTIVGAIRRHFRDATWSIKVPRRVQELRTRIDAAHDALAQELGRSPTVNEIAARADVDPQDVLDSLEVSRARTPQSLAPDNSEEISIADKIGDLDTGLTEIENNATVRALLATLPERERRIVVMRFFDGASQTQIAEALGMSQMHVSRLLAKSLAELRSTMGDEASPTVSS